MGLRGLKVAHSEPTLGRNGGTAQLRATEAAIQASGVKLELLPVREAKDIRDAIEHAMHAHVQGLIVLTSPMILTQRALIIDLGLKARLPMISGFTTFPKAGGMMALKRTVYATRAMAVKRGVSLSTR
jgi:ABC-type uncharacterized transport system substrate-binding protein